MFQLRMLCITAYLVLLLIFSINNAFSQNENLLKPVVLIQSDYETGAGFLVGEDDGILYFLTAYHVIADPADIRLRFYGINTARAKVLRVNEKYDIAVISCSAPTGYQVPTSFAIAKTPPVIQQEVVTIGHPAGNDWDKNFLDMIKALEHDFDDNLFTITPNGISAGSSGGPVLNEQNEFLGLVTTEDEIKAVCVSQELLLRMLKSWNVPLNLFKGISGPANTSFTDPWAGTMVFVAGGSYQRGSKDGNTGEQPVKKISVDGFYMAATEVTQAQWKAIMGNNPSFFTNCDQCPVEQVSWEDAQLFLIKLSQKTGHRYCLPTEAEWEYAARGGKLGKGFTYAGSNDASDVAWYGGNSDGKTHPVGQKKANELGLYDMSGNVYEWCADWYGKDYYRISPGDNPLGPDSGKSRVSHGGSFYHEASLQRVASRTMWKPDFRGLTLGFRLAKTP